MGKARDLARVIVDSSGLIAAGNLGNAVPADGSITNAKIASVAASKLTGQVPDANAPSGSVLQVVSSTQTTQQTISQSGSGENRGSAWYDTSGLNVTITPLSSSSKFLIFGNVVLGTSATDNYNIHWRLNRNGTVIGNGENGVYSWACMGSVRNMVSAGLNHGVFSYVDSPGTGSSLTYKLQVAQTNFSLPIYINRNGNDGWQAGSSSTITVLEIAG